MRSKLIGTFTAVILGVVLIRTFVAAQDSPTTKDSYWPLEDRRVYCNFDEIGRAFTDRGVMNEVHRGTVGGQEYAVVAAYPYAGPASADVYCYLFDRSTWILHTLTFVRQVRKVDVKETDSGITILSDGRPVISIALKQSDKPDGKN